MYNRPTVTPTPRRAINVPVASEGATLAASALGTAAEAFQRERERAGRIRADAAEAEIRGIGARLGDEVSRMQRTQAFGAETMVAERWDTETAKVLSQIGDAEVRDLVTRRSNVLRQELVERARRHGLNQQEVVAGEAYQRNQTDDLNLLRTTPLADAESVVERIGLRAQDRARTQGMDPEAMQAEVATARSKARLMQVNALVQNDQAEQALAFLERENVRGDMATDDYDKARRLVEGETMEVRAQAGRDAIVAEYTTEAEALAAVKERYSGEMEQRVRQYVVQDFADRDRREREAVSANTDAALRGIIDGRGIPAEARRFLYENDPKTLDELTRYQTTRARGEEPETDYEVFEDLLAQYVESPTEFAQVDLAKYRNQLSDRHYEELTRYKVGQRGQRERVSPLAVNRFVWSEAKRVGIIPSERTGVADLKDRKEERERYGLLEGAVKSALDAALAENPRLTAREQIAVMQDVIDNQVIVESGRFFVTTDTMPAAVVRPGERVVGSMARVAPADLSTPLTPAGLNRARELQRQGKTAEEIARTLRQEGLLSPTP